ncbi:outer membrane beta-barrel protein [uncultured Lutibacter sp.]|uniref:outer membrane beta-barrel protein n=1 Tax=uncultured Lutibacter sp. TaxID=437739 RepID=UPI00261D16A3|nr:outer membrane beta-barrel protein [uncultured Lutibacter sp.]
MNKRIALFSIVFLSTLCFVNAQNDFGIKGGLSYNSNGDLKEFTSEVTEIYKNEGKGKSGYNIGLYGKLDLGPIFLRPELVYTKTTSEYELNSTTVSDYNVAKLDMPVLVGIKLIGPLNIFAGPAFQYYLDNDLDGINISDVENDFTVGLNIGASIELGRLGIDVRYERGLNENESTWSNLGNTFTLDSRQEQIIFNLSYSLSKSNK